MAIKWSPGCLCCDEESTSSTSSSSSKVPCTCFYRDEELAIQERTYLAGVGQPTVRTEIEFSTDSYTGERLIFGFLHEVEISGLQAANGTHFQAIESDSSCIDFLSLPPDPDAIEFDVTNTAYRDGVLQFSEVMKMRLTVTIVGEADISAQIEAFGRNSNDDIVTYIGGAGYMQCEFLFDQSKTSDDIKTGLFVRAAETVLVSTNEDALWGQSHDDHFNPVKIGTIKSVLIWA